MAIVTIDNRSFKLGYVQETMCTDCSIDSKKYYYLDLYFWEDDKMHFVRLTMAQDETTGETYIDESIPAEWFVKE